MGISQLPRTMAWLLLLCCWPLGVALAASASKVVAIIPDSDASKPATIIEQELKAELLALTKGEFQIRFKTFHGKWSLAGIQQAYEQAYADADVDMVLVSGMGASQVGLARKKFPKPTFLPLVYDLELAGRSSDGTASGTPNLSYLIDKEGFATDVAYFHQLVDFKRLVILLDLATFSAVPDLLAYARAAEDEVGVKILPVPYGPLTPNLPKFNPAEDAVMLGVLGRTNVTDLKALIDQLNEQRLPTYSLQGAGLVKLGVLAASSPEEDIGRLARRNALNMQAVLLGEEASELSVLFKGRRELVINMATAQAVGVSPNYAVLSEAVLIEPEVTAAKPLSLRDAMVRAAEQNLEVQAERHALLAGRQAVLSAKGNLLPRLSLTTDATQVKVTPNVQLGLAAERTLEAQLSVSQPIYSDDVWAGVAIQQALQLSREDELAQLKLDIVQDAAIAYLDVLRAKTRLRVELDNLNLTRENLVLAEQRVAIGAATVSDRLRWQSELADARGSVQFSRAQVDQARENLNRVLNLPLGTATEVKTVQLDEALATSEARFNAIVSSPRRFQYLVDFYAQRAVKNAPELRQITAQITAKQREITNLDRDAWVPDVTFNAGVSDTLAASGEGSARIYDSPNWSVGVNASLSLGTGGQQFADRRAAEQELLELKALQANARLVVQQRLRAAAYDVNAAFANITFSAQSAKAAAANLALIADGYAKGAVSVVDLLDAQNASFSAAQASANAKYDFLVEMMEAQRAIGAFDILLSPEQRQADVQALAKHLDQRAKKEGLR